MLLGLSCLLLAGCEPTTRADCFRDAAAIDLALATMTDGQSPAPTPDKCLRCGGDGWITHGDGHKTPCPDCQDGAGPFGGPLDTIRGAKDLIRKGNELADRSKDLLVSGEIVDDEGGTRTFAVKTSELSKIKGARGARWAHTEIAAADSTGSIFLAALRTGDRVVRGVVLEHPKEKLLKGWVYVPRTLGR